MRILISGRAYEWCDFNPGASYVENPFCGLVAALCRLSDYKIIVYT